MLAQRIRDPEREIALEDANRLRESLQRGDERVFSVSLYLLLRAPTLTGLDEATRRVEAQLDGLLTQSRVALFGQECGFRSCLPEGRDQLLVPRNLDMSSLAISLPLASSSLIMERGVLYGVSAESKSPIIIDPFDDTLDNSNLAVVAPSGSGKSYFVKLMALRNRCRLSPRSAVHLRLDGTGIARDILSHCYTRTSGRLKRTTFELEVGQNRPFRCGRGDSW